MIGRLLPVTGAEIRTWRSVARPGSGSTTGLIEKTGVGTGLRMACTPYCGFAAGLPAAVGRRGRSPARLEAEHGSTTIWNIVPVSQTLPEGTAVAWVSQHKRQPEAGGPMR